MPDVRPLSLHSEPAGSGAAVRIHGTTGDADRWLWSFTLRSASVLERMYLAAAAPLPVAVDLTITVEETGDTATLSLPAGVTEGETTPKLGDVRGDAGDTVTVRSTAAAFDPAALALRGVIGCQTAIVLDPAAGVYSAIAATAGSLTRLYLLADTAPAGDAITVTATVAGVDAITATLAAGETGAEVTAAAGTYPVAAGDPITIRVVAGAYLVGSVALRGLLSLDI